MSASTNKQVLVLTVVSVLLLGAAITVVVIGMRGDDEFPWGIHMVTIPAVFLVGLVVGYVTRDKQAAEERAREEIEKGD